MPLKEAQALTNPFVRCRDGRIGQIIRMRAGYAPDDSAQDAVGVQVRGERELRWIPVQNLIQGRDGLCQEMGKSALKPSIVQWRSVAVSVLIPDGRARGRPSYLQPNDIV